MRALAIIPSALVLSLAAGACARQDGPMRGSAAAVDSAAAQGTPAASVTSGEATVVVPAFRVPFVVGLTTVRAVSRPAGDYETLRIIESITPDGYRMVVSADASDDGPREVSIVRRVRGEDQRNARSVRIYLHTSDAEEFAGTTPGVSAAIVADLRRTGKAALTFLDVGPAFGVSVVKRELSGTVTRVEPGPVPIRMLVNGRTVELPAIHAKGSLSDGAESEEVEFHVLDDPENPILLRSRGPGFSSSLVRIEYPEPPGAPESIEEDLAANRPAEVYGIYFSFARAEIRPQSEGVLRDIARVLKKNPDWRLRIDGHTDAIGGEAANLDLSRRRAAAVRTALVERHGIDAARLTSGGYGAGSPKDRNDTPEGRARNRRVELRRE